MDPHEPTHLERLAKEDSRDRITIDTSRDCRDAAVALATKAGRSLAILTRDMDPAIYDNQPFIDAVSALALSHRRARIRLLVQDSGTAAREGHRFIHLAQRLTTFIQIRKPSRDYEDLRVAYLVADDSSYMKRRRDDRFEATVCFNDRPLANEMLREFDEMWESATPDSNLRRLHL